MDHRKDYGQIQIAPEAEALEKDQTEDLGDQMSTEKPVEKETEEKEKEEIEIVEERMYNLPFRRVWATPRGKRTPRALRMLREYVGRHMKVENVVISNEINEQIWEKGIGKPPRNLRIRVVKDKEGKVIVYPAKGG